MQAHNIPLLEPDFSKASSKFSNRALRLAVSVEPFWVCSVDVYWLIAGDLRIVEVPGRHIIVSSLLYGIPH